MIAVKFTRMMQPYCAGDVAGLPDEKADRAIRQGYATKYDPKAETPAERKAERPVAPAGR